MAVGMGVKGRERVDVAIVGAGPVGLATALGLARLGVRSIVLERAAGLSTRSKAPAIHARTREILAQWGVLEGFMAEGTLLPLVELHDHDRATRATIDFRELEDDVDRPGILFLEQAHTERLLLEAVLAAGVAEVRFGAEVVGLRQPRADARRSAEDAAASDPRRVVLTVADAGRRYEVEADFVVGADGARSYVRRSLGLPFEGMTYRIRPMLADVRVRDGRDALAWPRLRSDRGGITPAFRLGIGLWRIIRLEAPHPSRGDDVPDDEVQRRALEVLGDGPPLEVLWASRFHIHLRSSPRFRVGRALLAGDAAHVHSPAGGLGMNAGIQDAHNLAWKLATALRGGDVDALLDAYEVERRHASVERVSRYTDALTRIFLLTPAPVREAAFAGLRAMLRVPRVRRRAARRQAMVDIVYPASGLIDPGDAAAGTRLPNPLVRAAGGERLRLHDALPEGPVLLDLGGSGGAAEVSRVPVLRFGAGGALEAGGALAALAAAGRWVLVRPDRHVAWVRRDGDALEPHVRRALGLGRGWSGQDPGSASPDAPSAGQVVRERSTAST